MYEDVRKKPNISDTKYLNQRRDCSLTNDYSALRRNYVKTENFENYLNIKKEEEYEINKKKKKDNYKIICNKKLGFNYLLLILSVILFYSFYCYLFSNNSSNISKCWSSLKNNYQNDNSKEWNQFLRSFKNITEIPKSILLLCDIKSTTTCSCFQKLLSSICDASLHSSYSSYEINDYDEDYGKILEILKPVVKKHRLHITNLDEISGSTARIFQSLIDETYDDGNAPTFIFLLKDRLNNKPTKPSLRVRTILQEAWKELDENEINPLFSRIITNVISITPESYLPCL